MDTNTPGGSNDDENDRDGDSDDDDDDDDDDDFKAKFCRRCFSLSTEGAGTATASTS